jgi:hypothetical protein
MEWKAESLEGLAQDTVQHARFARDAAGPMRDIVSQLPADSLLPKQWEDQKQVVRSWLEVAGQVQTTRTLINTFGATSYAAINTTSSTLFMKVGSIQSPTPIMQVATAKLNQIFERTPLVETARASMRRLRLDDRGESDRQTPLEILDQAKAALDRPSLPERESLSVLIGLRECINAAIGKLLLRRPRQEPASKPRDKLTSLGCQSARPGLRVGHFEGLATEWDSLSNDLAGAKQGRLSRQQVSELFNRGVLFLNALLESIDETKLR